MSVSSRLAVVVVAGGSGQRASRHHGDLPKQYRMVGGQAVLARCLEGFLRCPDVDLVVPVIGRDHQGFYEALKLEDDRLLPPVTGGADRQTSTLHGLRALASHSPDLVMVHDGARPFVSSALIGRVLAALEEHGGALPALPVTDTLKRSDDGRRILRTEDRSTLWAAQTPQGFSYPALLAAHERLAQTNDGQFTDDGAIAQWAGMDVVLVPGEHENFKITTGADFARARSMSGDRKDMETRVGTGLDIHQFEPGERVRLGGVDIPHRAKLKGHSDADAALHVLTDALLGALAEGDIGTHFPPGEAKWKGEPSDTFLRFAASRVRARGGRIVHLDLTIVSEAPKISPVATRIRQNIAEICDIPVSRVSVKATTAEKLGFLGRGEGLLASGAATIEVPREEA